MRAQRCWPCTPLPESTALGKPGLLVRLPRRPTQEGRTLSARFRSRCRVRPLGQTLNELPRERCNVSGNVVSVPPTHRKIHLCVRADERRHEIILVKSVLSTNYLKGRRVCDDAPRTSANNVTCRASILSYMPATLDIPRGCHSRYKQRRDAGNKTKSITLHKVLRLIRAVLHAAEREKRTGWTSPFPSASWSRAMPPMGSSS